MHRFDLHRLLKRTADEERGYALVLAIVFMGIMLTIGFAAVRFSDGETRSTGRERISESRLNLTEGALSAGVYELSRTWPKSTSWNDCTDTSTDAYCPTATDLKSHFTGADFTVPPTWTIKIRDDASGTNGSCAAPPGPGFYSDASILPLAHYDANNNCVVWIRAEGTLNGAQRVVVAQARAEYRPVAFPGGPFMAGSFDVSNNGVNKTMVDGNTVAGQVRCDATTGGSNCIYWRGQQVADPASVVPDTTLLPTALDPGTIAALKKQAQTDNTYYTSCPADPSGKVVWVETGNCTYTNINVNASSKAGVFVVNNGTLVVGGNTVWYGAIYALNAQGCSPTQTTGCIHDSGYLDTVVETKGTPEIHGGIYIDGNGRLDIGSSGDAGSNNANLIYDPTVWGNLGFYGTADLVQNTWRELIPG